MTRAIPIHLMLNAAWAVTIGVLLYQLAPLITPGSLVLAIAAAAALPMVWLPLLVWRYRLSRRRPETRAFAAWFNRLAMWLENVATVAVGGIVLPQVDATWQAIGVAYMTGTIAVEFLATVRPPPATGWGSFAPMFLVVTTIIYVALHGGPAAAPMIVYLAAFGYLMLLMRRILQRQANHLHRALTEVAAQRDARTRFLAAASHDLGQPLQAARLSFDLAMRSPDGPARDRAARNVRQAFKSTERLLADMLEHLRFEAGKVEAKLERVAIGPLVARIAEMHESEARLVGTGIVALPSRLHLRADPTLVERAVVNLVGNAIRHAKASRILIGVRRRGPRVRLWVVDDGVGISQRDLPGLFDDYVQGSNHGDETRGGFGLGLASARRMAGLMGGEIGLDRRWIGGSAFWLELDAA